MDTHGPTTYFLCYGIFGLDSLLVKLFLHVFLAALSRAFWNSERFGMVGCKNAELFAESVSPFLSPFLPFSLPSFLLWHKCLSF
jgi:hypothetical protein